MRLGACLPKQDDLEWCASILQDGFEQRPDLKAYLPTFWTRLLDDNAMTTFVLKDYDCRGPNRVGFGAFVFVSDVCRAALERDARPYAALQIVDRARASGDYGGILGSGAIRQVNGSGGLNLLVLHLSEVVTGYSHEDQARIRKKLAETLMKAAFGFNLKEVVFEFFGKNDLPYLLNFGFKLRTDFSQFFSQRRDLPPDHAWPHVVGLKRSERTEKDGTRIAELFRTPERRFDFTDAELAVLTRASSGRTDLEITESLGLERNAVMMRWRSVFARVERRAPGFFSGAELESDVTPRDAKRRRLLAYLEDYPDELRPIERRRG